MAYKYLPILPCFPENSFRLCPRDKLLSCWKQGAECDLKIVLLTADSWPVKSGASVARPQRAHGRVRSWGAQRSLTRPKGTAGSSGCCEVRGPRLRRKLRAAQHRARGGASPTKGLQPQARSPLRRACVQTSSRQEFLQSDVGLWVRLWPDEGFFRLYLSSCSTSCPEGR